MRLSLHEQERLLVTLAAMVARDRQQRGLKLNHPEAVAMLTSYVLEGAREGRSVADLMDAGRHVLDDDDVLPGVAQLVGEVQVEATFPDGTKLVTLHDPIGPGAQQGDTLAPGEVVTDGPPVVINLGRTGVTVMVENAGDRPIQVGSHYHFAEANPALAFDRIVARGHRLDIPAGTAVRFEPGVTREVDLVPLAGRRAVWGLRGDVAGALDAEEGHR